MALEITQAIIADFRIRYPEFADDTTWTDAIVSIALTEGDVESGGCGWGGYVVAIYSNFKLRGMYAYAAHWLVVNYGSSGSSTGGGAIYATQSKAVGDENISFNNGSDTIMAGDAPLAATRYGQDFLRFRKRAGIGARAV